MNRIKRFLADLTKNPAYMIPAFALAVTSLFHLFVPFGIDITPFVLLVQLLFFIWALIVALRKKFVFWPVFIFALIPLVVSAGLGFQNECKLERISQALKADESIKARELFQSVYIEKTVKSNQYSYLRDIAVSRIQQQVSDLSKKARTEIIDGKLKEAKKTVSLILEYDSINLDASYMAEGIIEKEIAEEKKSLVPDQSAKLDVVLRDVRIKIDYKKFVDARTSIDQFILKNSEFKKDQPVIQLLEETVRERERTVEIPRQRQLNYERLDAAWKFYNKNDFKNSAEKAEEILSYDRNNRQALDLLAKAKQALYAERYSLARKAFILAAVLILIGVYIKHRYL